MWTTIERGLWEGAQERRDEEHTAELERRVMEKLARVDIIDAQRQSIDREMQRVRKDIATQEAWLKARPCPPRNKHIFL